MENSTPVMQKNWRSFRMAAWLGWKIESNWTDPFLFAIYSIVKPLAAAMILVVMYGVISRNQFDSPVFAYLFIGNAFYQYVSNVMVGVSWAIVDDREHYRTLKYLYVSPISIPFYLLGRGVARVLITTFSVVVILAVGVAFLHIPFNPAVIDWPLFITSLLIGILMLAMLGLLLAGFTLRMAQYSFNIGDSVAGALYLFSGAIFPISVLPAFLRPLGYIMPISYWLELIRRAMVGGVAADFPMFPGFSNLQLLLILIGMTIIFGFISVWGWKKFDWQARERGLIDQTNNY
jgi:ABC-2 type transport system permease protein